jgi:hypothetical protein
MLRPFSRLFHGTLQGGPDGRVRGTAPFSADELAAYVAKFGHLHIEGHMAFGIRLVKFHQFHVKLVQQIREKLKVGTEIVYRHVPQHPVRAGGVAAQTVSEGRNQLAPGKRYKTGGGGDLAVQVVKMKALVPVLLDFFGKHLNLIPRHLVQGKLEQGGTDKAVGYIGSVVLADPFNQSGYLRISYLQKKPPVPIILFPGWIDKLKTAK